MLYREIKGNRVIWLRALRALERNECLMPSTYLTSDISGRDSRHSACLPYRLASAVLGKGAILSVTRIFHLDTAGQGPPPQYAVYLVPGGRWIFHTDRGTNINSSEPARISCSDLARMDGAGTMRSFPLRFPVDTWPTIFGIQSDPDNFRTAVLVSYQRAFPVCVCLSVVSSAYTNVIFRRYVEVLYATWLPEIRSDNMPAWSRAAHMAVDIAEQVRSMVLGGQYVIVPLSYSLIVWQWHTGEWATIKFGPQRVSSSLRDMRCRSNASRSMARLI